MPRAYCGWQHRWDDPRRQYRTLYCAAQAITCLREVLADLRPNTRMLADMQATVGRDAALATLAGTVTAEFQRERVLVLAKLELDGELIDVDEPATRHQLEQRHAALLSAHGMDHLDIAAIRGRTRIVTQTIGRSLYEAGAGGVAFGSNHDDQPCYALFEGHAQLQADPHKHKEPLELTPELDILQQVCDEWGLRVEPGP